MIPQTRDSRASAWRMLQGAEQPKVELGIKKRMLPQGESKLAIFT